MKILFNYWYGVPSNAEDRCKKIKDAGFDDVALYFSDDFVKANGKVKDIILTMKEKKLKFDALHLSFVNAGDIWKKGWAGYKRYQSYKNFIKKAKNLDVTNFVMHLNDDRNIKMSNLGLKRIKKLLKLCEKYNFSIAFENIAKVDNYFEEISSLFLQFPNAKICYDVGHANISGFDIKKYIDKISVFHLHDNYGLKDEHNLPYDGNLNWESVFEIIKKVNNPLIVLEVHNLKIKTEKQEIEYLKNCYKCSLKILQNIE